jgi:hypothetical protein
MTRAANEGGTHSKRVPGLQGGVRSALGETFPVRRGECCVEGEE